MTILPRKAIVTVVLACSVFNVQASNDGMDAGKSILPVLLSSLRAKLMAMETPMS